MGASTVPAAGGGASAADWTYIATAAPSGVASATFSSISGYKKLKVVGFVTSTASSAALILQFNGDTGNNYFSGANGVNVYMSTTAQGAALSNGIIISSGYLGGGTLSAGFNCDIENATLTTTFKNTIMQAANQTLPQYSAQGGGVWRSTSAITSITITNTATGNITGNIYLLGQN